MEAPEKLYIDFRDRAESTWRCAYNKKVMANNIEYTRTDAFIDKAVKYILTHIPDMHILGDSCRMDECIIEDFRKYMKGE